MKNNENKPHPDFGVFTPSADINAMSGELMGFLSRALSGNALNGEIYRSIYCVTVDLVDISKSAFNPERLIKRVQTVTLAHCDSQAFLR